MYHISSMRRDFGDGPNVLVLRRLRRFDELNGVVVFLQTSLEVPVESNMAPLQALF